MNKQFITLAAVAALSLPAITQAALIYAADSSRTELYNGTISRADDTRQDSSKLTVRGDYKAMKSWVEFDVSALDFSNPLTTVQLRLTLQSAASGTVNVSAVNDNVTSGNVALDGSVTWNTAPGNYVSADGTNAVLGGVTTDMLQDDLDPTKTTFIETFDYTGAAGDQFFINVPLSILQADTDGYVLFALHGSSGNMNFATHDITSLPSSPASQTATDYYPALNVIPEPATLSLVGIFGAGVLFFRRRFMI